MEWGVWRGERRRAARRIPPRRTLHPPPRFSYSGRLDLLPGVVARPHERTALDVPEAELHADLVEAAEVLRGHVPIERDVPVGRAQVLTEGEDVHVHGPQILHDRDDLLVGLTHPQDDPGLGGD